MNPNLLQKINRKTGEPIANLTTNDWSEVIGGPPDVIPIQDASPELISEFMINVPVEEETVQLTRSEFNFIIDQAQRFDLSSSGAPIPLYRPGRLWDQATAVIRHQETEEK